MTNRSTPHFVYVVTCARCGQSWLRRSARAGEAMDCLFCGRQGHLRLGLMPTDQWEGQGLHRIEVWLEDPGDHDM
jgi:hypothetical protein